MFEQTSVACQNNPLTRSEFVRTPLEERIDMSIEKIMKLIEEILKNLDLALEYYIDEMAKKESMYNAIPKLSDEEIAENNEWRLMEEETIQFDYETDWEWRSKSE